MKNKPLKAKYILADNTVFGGVTIYVWAGTLKEAKQYKKDNGYRIFRLGEEIDAKNT